MPPPPSETGFSRISLFPTSATGHGRLAELFLIAAVITLCLRLVKYRIARKRRKGSQEIAQLEEKNVSRVAFYGEEKELFHQSTRIPEEQRPPTFNPIYPWVTPPQPLPVPDRPESFPVPTLRRHSYVETSQQQPALDQTIISYTRRVSTNSIPSRKARLHGTVTISQNRWRRNQWVVTGE